MTTFGLPNAATEMNKAVAAAGGEDGNSWEIIGDPRLTKLVDEVTTAYGDKLDLKLDPSPGAKRAGISTMRWGKIGKDVARLTGLAGALENISAVVKSGKDTIALDWQGEAFDAFRVSIEKVEKTLDDYAAAVRTTADGLTRALAGAQQIFTRYRDDSLAKYLNFDKFSPPDKWRRMTPDDAAFFADRCTSHGLLVPDCMYDNDRFVSMIDRKLVNQRLFDQQEKWDCTNDPNVIIRQYSYTIASAYDERGLIRDTINEWYKATDQVSTSIGEALDLALTNLRILAELKVFATFSVPGASAATGAQGADPGPGAGGQGSGGGYPGPGAGGPGPGGGYPGGGTAMPEAAPEPEPAPVEPVAGPAPTEPAPTEPEATDPGATESAATAPDGTKAAASEPEAGTVQIKDGDRTISMQSPDGQGQVKLTVTDGSGATKSYLLDFGAASGQPRQPEDGTAAPAEDVEQVPARSDGKCVIQDGDVMIIAERPLFSPDALTIKIDDGAGSVTSYTVDFPDDPAPAPGEAQQPDTSASTVPPDVTGGAPATAQSATAQPDGGDGAPDTRSAAQQTPVTQEPGSGQQADVRTAAQQPAVDAVPADPQPANGHHVAQPAVVDAAQPAEAGAPQESAATSATSPQAWTNDQSGSLSGVLVSDQQDGEAGLAVAPDAARPQQPDSSDSSDSTDSATGMAGAGAPFLSAPGGGNASEESDRTGSGWSVHGDLFDATEPVRSMHGVLGEEDLERQ